MHQQWTPDCNANVNDSAVEQHRDKTRWPDVAQRFFAESIDVARNLTPTEVIVPEPATGNNTSRRASRRVCSLRSSRGAFYCASCIVRVADRVRVKLDGTDGAINMVNTME